MTGLGWLSNTSAQAAPAAPKPTPFKAIPLKYDSTYSPLEKYAKGALIYDNGNTYIALARLAAGVSPSSSPASWAPFTSVGPAGPQGIPGVDGAASTVPGPQGPEGPAGASVNLQVAGGYIQWQHVGDSSWQNLIALSAITGPAGSNAPIATPSIAYFGIGATFSLSFVTIGNPGNSNDTTGYGGVPYSYQMSVYDISQNQINVAASSGLNGMPTGDWTGDQPSTSISWYQAAAFVNWLNTSQGYAPAYNLSYSVSNGYSMALWMTNQAWTIGGTNLYRNAGCCYFLPSEDELYKAAYYDPTLHSGAGGYWQYPEGINTAPTAVASGTNAGTAVYNTVTLIPASVYLAGGLSPYGTMGQGGNVSQWAESQAYSYSNTDPVAARGIRGGSWSSPISDLKSSTTAANFPYRSSNNRGFRVAKFLP